MYDMTFPTPEIMNKYRDSDSEINKEILHEEEINKQNKNLSDMVDKNLNKYFNEKNNKPFVVDMLNLGNDFKDLIKIDKDKNKNLLKDVFEINEQYKFITDEIILDSFQKVFQDYNVVYTPYKKSKNIYVKYVLDKLKVNENVPNELFNHFNNSLTNLESKNKKIPVDNTDDGKMLLKDKIVKQTGQSINNNNIKIKDLDKGILRVRYSNNRKLSNKLLKDDYKSVNE